jgi:hypothetical protein
MTTWSLFSRKKPSPSRSAAAAPAKSVSSPNPLRREIVNVALRSTLNKHGVPSNWVAIDIQSSVSAGGEASSYVRLLLKHWDPRLMQYTVALQNSLLKSICLLDATAKSWLRSISWQIAVPDESICPAMPTPATWTMKAAAPAPAPSSAVPKLNKFDQLLMSMHDQDDSHYASVDFQNTEPFDHAAAAGKR